MDSRVSDRKLRRELTTWDLLMLSLGGIIGSGWLFAAFGAATTAGPGSIFAWIIGGVIIIFIALVYAELGAMIPRSGAIVRYGHLSHGSFAGFVLGWAYFLSAVSVPAIEAEGVITYAASYSSKYGIVLLTNTGVMSVLGTFLAMLLMLGFFFLNYAGIKIMGKTNTGLTWWKFVIPTLTVILLLVVSFRPSNIIVGGIVPYGWAPVFSAVATSGIVFSYLGFRQGIDYGGEAKTPQRSIPLATVFSVLIGILLYTALQIVFIGGIDWGKLGLVPGSWAQIYSLATSNSNPEAVALYDAPFAHIAQAAGLVFLTYILFADAYISPSGTLNVYLGTSTRTLYGMAANGHMPKKLLEIMDKNRIPFIPLLATLLIGYIFFLPFPSWYKMVGFITSATAFTYIVGGAALMSLRRTAPELKRPFKLPYARVLSPIAFIGAGEVVYWSGWPLVLYLAIAIFLGFAVYFVLLLLGAIENSFTKENIKAGLWVPIFIIVLTVLSYIGDTSLGGIGVIKFPFDLVTVAVISFIFYMWSVRSGIRTEDITEMIESGSQYVFEESAREAVGK
ncbi:amino acid transporter [Thermoplasma volcanium GSS1]|uniref:Amino acid transporter n=1 Tax=Thermoplasma volcanium (strain ATCC 51530 / DSM 4299 / JCM 9571 / NBRC 15438 / GSS1) TaxID=273116 RepID=Q979A0_THEVO|nr:amino acid permease [Thermoplasma volcanium]BAB60404.1 amino acid transporter [Thermoplasma volcanium GSS1]